MIPKNIEKTVFFLAITSWILTLALLFPTPWQQISYIDSAFEQQRVNLINDAKDMKISETELSRSLQFGKERKVKEVWVRSMAIILFIVVAFWFLSVMGSKQGYWGRIGFSTCSIVYVAFCALSILSYEGEHQSALDGFVNRILNEMLVNEWWVFPRFFIIYCINPVFYLTTFIALSGQAWQGDKS